MARPETPKLSLATTLSLIWASSWQVLDLPRVDQPDLQPLGLQQIQGRLPVVAGGLHDTLVTPSSASRSASASSERVIVA
jgi:hypothetical protein